MRLHSHKNRWCFHPLGSSSSSRSLGMIETKKHRRFKGGNPATRRGAARCNTNLAYIFKCHQYWGCSTGLARLFPGRRWIFFNLCRWSMRLRVLTQRPQRDSCNGERGRSGRGHQPTRQWQLFVYIDGSAAARYFPNRHLWLHSQSGGRQTAGRASRGAVSLEGSSSSTKFSHTDESAITDTLPNK